MNEQLSKKIEQAVRLIKLAGMDGDPVEVAYSGGKDSDVILQLTREAGINYRAIYKCTTIDPPHTLHHVKENGVEIRMPKRSFFDIIRAKGFPSRFTRFCCSELKEYKILDKCIIGVRREESRARSERYKEPTQCRFYGKKEHVEAFYPILEWTSQDVVDFVTDRGIKLHPLYYRPDGTIDPTRRLGCMCCPLTTRKKRLEEFKLHPNMVKAYIQAAQCFIENKPNTQAARTYPDAYAMFARELFFDKHSDWLLHCQGMFGAPDYKSFLEDYFNIKL